MRFGKRNFLRILTTKNLDYKEAIELAPAVCKVPFILSIWPRLMLVAYLWESLLSVLGPMLFWELADVAAWPVFTAPKSVALE